MSGLLLLLLLLAFALQVTSLSIQESSVLSHSALRLTCSITSHRAVNARAPVANATHLALLGSFDDIERD
jgi:hypothetical protein